MPAAASTWSRFTRQSIAVLCVLLTLVIVGRLALRPSSSLPDLLGSNFRCLGSDGDHRRCVFENVCLVAGNKGQWDIQFGLPPHADAWADSPVVEDAEAIPQESPQFVALRAEATYRKDSLRYLGVVVVPWSKLKAPNNTWHRERWFGYQLTADGDMNFGHFLLDDVFGVWETLREFGIDDASIRVGAVRNCKSFGRLEQQCRRQEADLWPTVTKFPVDSLTDMLAVGPQCFRELIVGTGAAGGISFGSVNVNRAAAFRQYRDAVYLANGVAVDSRSKRIHILLVQKRGRRAFVNFWETAEALQAESAFSSFKWTITETFDKLSFQQQLELISTVDIVVSPCGGLSMSFLLLPNGSSLIVAAYPQVAVDGAGQIVSLESGHMEGHLWRTQAHVFVQHYEIESEDDFELPLGIKTLDWAAYRNAANIVLEPDRLRPYLSRAVYQAQYRRLPA